jgi:hypothetical protein
MKDEGMIQHRISLDTTIDDIHRVREQMAAKFGGDLNAILDDARKRQAASGRAVWQGASQNDALSGVEELSSTTTTEREWNFRDDIHQEYMCDIPESQPIITLTLNWKSDELSAARLVGKYRINLGLLEPQYVRKTTGGKFFLRFQRTDENIEIALNRHSPALKVGQMPQ